MPDTCRYSKQFQTVVTFESLDQTWYGKIWRLKAKFIECESNFIDTLSRAWAGLNPTCGVEAAGEAPNLEPLSRGISNLLKKIERHGLFRLFLETIWH